MTNSEMTLSQIEREASRMRAAYLASLFAAAANFLTRSSRRARQQAV